MRKLRSDSPWAKLTEEQRATLGAWLLDENLPYREALERSAGLLRLNMNELTALEDFLLASLRIWAKR